MEHYKKSGPASTGVQHSDEKAPSTPCVGGGSALLVNTPISHRKADRKNPVESLLVYHRAVKLVRPYKGDPDRPTPPTRTEINSFSSKSRSRLKFTAGNSPQLVSQFGMTYHKATPDGREVKRHLNLFLNSVKRHYPWFQYLWILEFQSRGIPHFHLFCNLDIQDDTRANLASIWHRIAEPESTQHLRFHRNRKNFIEWDMGTGAYLCKYLSKESQKCVPDGFTGVGRFWGNSRGLVPEPEIIETCDLQSHNGDVPTKALIRSLCRHHEKSLRRWKSPWKSSARKRSTSYTLPNGASVFWRLYGSLPEPEEPSFLLDSFFFSEEELPF